MHISILFFFEDDGVAQFELAELAFLSFFFFWLASPTDELDFIFFVLRFCFHFVEQYLAGILSAKKDHLLNLPICDKVANKWVRILSTFIYISI